MANQRADREGKRPLRSSQRHRRRHRRRRCERLQRRSPTGKQPQRCRDEACVSLYVLRYLCGTRSGRVVVSPVGREGRPRRVVVFASLAARFDGLVCVSAGKNPVNRCIYAGDTQRWSSLARLTSISGVLAVLPDAKLRKPKSSPVFSM
jgi:hypothetical protein